MKKLAILIVGALVAVPARADLDAAITDARASCAGISDGIKKLRTIAGVNTAVSGVGAVAAGGAFYAGLKKDQADKLTARIDEQLAKLTENKLTDEEFFHLLGDIAEWKAESDRRKGLEDARTAAANKSETLGNWRTGLMVGSTAANIGGAIISNKNKNDGAEIKDMIAACLDSVKTLRSAAMQALIDGADAGSLVWAQEITDACGRHSVKDADNIPKWQDVAKWSSVAGIGTGAAGTATSIAANTKQVRAKNDETEKGLNLASNVLAGASVVASGVAAGFNIATLVGINRTLKAAEECEGALR